MLDTLLDNEGGPVTLSYADNTQDDATINQLQIQDGAVEAELTIAGTTERLFCILRTGSDEESTLDCYRDSEQLSQRQSDRSEPVGSRQPDRRVVEITGASGD